jgi:hypothetical protein
MIDAPAVPEPSHPLPFLGWMTGEFVDRRRRRGNAEGFPGRRTPHPEAAELFHGRPGRAPRPATPGPRRGSVMVMAVACMAVAIAIGLTMLRTATTAHRSLRTERQLRQVELLLAAAAELAQERIAMGEPAAARILLEPAAITGTGSARITLSPGPAAASVRLVVEYPLEGPVTIRRSRTVPLASVPAISPEESLP